MTGCSIKEGDIVYVPITGAKAEVISVYFNDWSEKWFVETRHLETDKYRRVGTLTDWYASDLTVVGS